MRQVNLGLEADHIFKTTLLLPDRYKSAEQVHVYQSGAGARECNPRGNICGGIEFGGTQ